MFLILFSQNMWIYAFPGLSYQHGSKRDFLGMRQGVRMVKGNTMFENKINKTNSKDPGGGGCRKVDNGGFPYGTRDPASSCCLWLCKDSDDS